MISEAKAFWDSISGKVKELIHAETNNSMRVQRYDVTTAPNGTVMGVTQPFGANEVFLPYSREVAGATVGDTVLVAWWGSMSNARVYYFAKGYDGAQTVSPYNSAPADLGTASAGTSDEYARGDHVHDLPSTLSGMDFKVIYFNSSDSKTITFGQSSAAVIFAAGRNAGRCTTINIFNTVNNSIYYDKSTTASNITLSASSNVLTITNASQGSLYCLMIVYAGSATVS